MEATFNGMWCQVFGPPTTLVLDLESGLQAGLARFSEWHGRRIRPIAAKAQIQQGAWTKVVDENAVVAEDVPMATTSVNTALNTLKQDSGFSPSQAVWGRDPQLPEEILGGPHVEPRPRVDEGEREKWPYTRKGGLLQCHRDAKCSLPEDAGGRTGVADR